MTTTIEHPDDLFMEAKAAANYFVIDPATVDGGTDALLVIR